MNHKAPSGKSDTKPNWTWSQSSPLHSTTLGLSVDTNSKKTKCFWFRAKKQPWQYKFYRLEMIAYIFQHLPMIFVHWGFKWCRDDTIYKPSLKLASHRFHQQEVSGFSHGLMDYCWKRSSHYLKKWTLLCNFKGMITQSRGFIVKWLHCISHLYIWRSSFSKRPFYNWCNVRASRRGKMKESWQKTQITTTGRRAKGSLTHAFLQGMGDIQI